jgi:hypothetical protein
MDNLGGRPRHHHFGSRLLALLLRRLCRAAWLLGLADEIWQRGRHMLARRIVSGAGFAELQAELCRRIVKGLDARARWRKKA